MSASEQRLFVSYSTEDATVVNQIVSRLRDLGLGIWLDQSQITAADNIVQRVDDGLARWKYFLLFASNSYFSSPWATSEYRAAFYAALGANERKIIIIRLDEVELPPLIAANRHIKFTTTDSVAQEIARTVTQIDLTQTHDAQVVSVHRAVTQRVDWDEVQDRALFAILSELFVKKSELVRTLGQNSVVNLRVPINAELVMILEVSKSLLCDRVLLPEMESEWQNYQTVARIAATLRRRVLQGGLAILEGPFEVELETRETQLAEIKRNLRTQLGALSHRLFVEKSTIHT
jgi:TIR domain